MRKPDRFTVIRMRPIGGEGWYSASASRSYHYFNMAGEPLCKSLVRGFNEYIHPTGTRPLDIEDPADRNSFCCTRCQKAVKKLDDWPFVTKKKRPKNKHGGPRKGAGAPKKAPTKTKSFRLQMSTIETLEKHHKRRLNKVVSFQLDEMAKRIRDECDKV